MVTGRWLALAIIVFRSCRRAADRSVASRIATGVPAVTFR
jgi:hypothetical protein